MYRSGWLSLVLLCVVARGGVSTDLALSTTVDELAARIKSVDQNELDVFLSKNEYALVYFYRPHDPACIEFTQDTLMDVFHKTGLELEVTVLKFDVTNHEDFTRENGIKTVPAIQMWKQQDYFATMELAGGQSRQSFVDWVHRRVGKVEEVSSLKNLEKLITFSPDLPGSCMLNTYVLSVATQNVWSTTSFASIMESADFDSSCFVISRSEVVRKALVGSIEKEAPVAPLLDFGDQPVPDSFRYTSAVLGVIKGYGRRYGITNPAIEVADDLVYPGDKNMVDTQAMERFMRKHNHPVLYEHSPTALRWLKAAGTAQPMHVLVLADEKGNGQQKIENNKALAKFAALHETNPGVYRTYTFDSDAQSVLQLGAQNLPPPVSVILDSFRSVIKMFWADNFDFEKMETFESNYVINPKETVQADLAARKNDPAQAVRVKTIQALQKAKGKAPSGAVEIGADGSSIAEV